MSVCVNCPNEALRRLCNEIMSSSTDALLIVTACGTDNSAKPQADYLDLEQRVRISRNGATTELKVAYRYFLNSEKSRPRFEGVLPNEVPISDLETFAEDLMIINNVTDDIRIATGWDVRLDTHGVDFNNLPTTLPIKFSRFDPANAVTYTGDFWIAAKMLDMALFVFFEKWRLP